jgi:RHS repeat-associated protein
MSQAFVGRFDATSGLYHFRHRDYFPTTGRWTTPDPLGFAAGDANLYRYVGNRATIATDPSGNIAWFVAVPLVLGVGGFTWLTGSTVLTAERTTGRWSDASTWAALWDGLRLGIQANVNGLASAARSLLTLGVWNEPWEVWAVDEVDRPVYQEGFLAARFGWELLPTAGIGRLTQTAGQMGRWGRWALVWDAGQNAVQAGRGSYDIYENGLTWTNGLQVVGSLLGLGGNYATWRRLPGGAPNSNGSQTSAATGPALPSTAHGAERIAGAGATRGGVLSETVINQTRQSGRVMIQADGAKVYVHEVEPGRFNVVVWGERGLITTFERLSQKSLDRLGKNYGWK